MNFGTVFLQICERVDAGFLDRSAKFLYVDDNTVHLGTVHPNDEPDAVQVFLPGKLSSYTACSCVFLIDAPGPASQRMWLLQAAASVEFAHQVLTSGGFFDTVWQFGYHYGDAHRVLMYRTALQECCGFDDVDGLCAMASQVLQLCAPGVAMRQSSELFSAQDKMDSLFFKRLSDVVTRVWGPLTDVEVFANELVWVVFDVGQAEPGVLTLVSHPSGFVSFFKDMVVGQVPAAAATGFSLPSVLPVADVSPAELKFILPTFIEHPGRVSSVLAAYRAAAGVGL